MITSSLLGLDSAKMRQVDLDVTDNPSHLSSGGSSTTRVEQESSETTRNDTNETLSPLQRVSSGKSNSVRSITDREANLEEREMAVAVRELELSRQEGDFTEREKYVEDCEKELERRDYASFWTKEELQKKVNQFHLDRSAWRDEMARTTCRWLPEGMSYSDLMEEHEEKVKDLTGQAGYHEAFHRMLDGRVRTLDELLGTIRVEKAWVTGMAQAEVAAMRKDHDIIMRTRNTLLARVGKVASNHRIVEEENERLEAENQRLEKIVEVKNCLISRLEDRDHDTSVFIVKLQDVMEQFCDEDLATVLTNLQYRCQDLKNEMGIAGWEEGGWGAVAGDINLAQELWIIAIGWALEPGIFPENLSGLRGLKLHQHKELYGCVSNAIKTMGRQLGDHIERYGLCPPAETLQSDNEDSGNDAADEGSESSDIEGGEDPGTETLDDLDLRALDADWQISKKLEEVQPTQLERQESRTSRAAFGENCESDGGLTPKAGSLRFRKNQCWLQEPEVSTVVEATPPSTIMSGHLSRKTKESDIQRGLRRYSHGSTESAIARQIRNRAARHCEDSECNKCDNDPYKCNCPVRNLPGCTGPYQIPTEQGSGLVSPSYSLNTEPKTDNGSVEKPVDGRAEEVQAAPAERGIPIPKPADTRGPDSLANMWRSEATTQVGDDRYSVSPKTVVSDREGCWW